MILLCTVFASCAEENDECICGAGVFTSPVDNGIIEGELFLPAGDGPFPVLIIVPGSGPELRQTDAPFADILNPVGQAVYIYDKRGIGGSTGSYPPEDEDGTEFLSARADDIVAIINTLTQHANIDPNEIGIVGASQGTWVNALVYDKYPGIARMILTSGGAVPTGYEQYYDNLLLDHPELSVEEGHEMLRSYEGHVGFDSRPIFERMSMPVLFILGGKDRSHPTLWERDYIESLNKTNFEIQFYENSNHEMIDVDSGEFHPDLLPSMLEWLLTNS